MKSTTIENYLILIGAFLISFFINGCGRLSPILFPESVVYYDVDRDQASFPFVLCYLISDLIGPFIGYLEQIFGMQKVIMTGCVLSALSIAACYFSESILTITILWGVVYGSGLGLAIQLIPVILNKRFPKDKSKANSLFLAGTALGGFMLPVIFQALFYNYGMAGSFLLLGALMAHSIPACILLKNYSKSESLQNIEKPKETGNLNKNATAIYEIDLKYKDKALRDNFETIPGKFFYKEFENNTPKINNKPISKDSLSMSSNNTLNEINEETRLIKKVNFSFEAFKIFIDPVYIEILLSHALSFWVILVFWTIILDAVRDKGVAKIHEIYFVVCLPIAGFLCRLICGHIIDKWTWKSSTTLSLLCVGMAFSLICFNFASSYALILAMEIIMAFFISTVQIQQVALVHDFIEEKREAMAMSCRMLLFSPITLFISPMIGYIRGNFGSYDYIMYIMSGVSFLCACITYTVPYISRWQNKK